MNTKLVNSAAGAINAALMQNRTAAGIALALESAQMLMSPETAAELDRLKLRLAELERAYSVDTAALQRRIDGLERERRESGPSAEWFAEAFSPKPAEGEHYASTHHDYRTPRDLPELGGQR